MTNMKGCPPMPVKTYRTPRLSSRMFDCLIDNAPHPLAISLSPSPRQQLADMFKALRSDADPSPTSPPVAQPRSRRRNGGGVWPTHDWAAGDREAESFSGDHRRAHGQLPEKGELVDHMEEWWRTQQTTPVRKAIARKLPKHLYRAEN